MGGTHGLGQGVRGCSATGGGHRVEICRPGGTGIVPICPLGHRDCPWGTGIVPALPCGAQGLSPPALWGTGIVLGGGRNFPQSRAGPAGVSPPSLVQVLQILAGKVVVGHAIHNDFKALHYCHPKALTRDTSQIPLLNRRAGFPENVNISLKRLTKALLNQDIQVPWAAPHHPRGHSAVATSPGVRLPRASVSL
uniref:Uncharacterized protein n=1 Tax=Zonotrichia albicollis TaxID=44394 RepID=A0A8D2M2Q5_ZONAL